MTFILFPRDRERHYERERQRGLVMEAQVSKAMLSGAADDLVRAYRDLIDAASNGISGIPSRTQLFLRDQLAGLHDELCNLDHECNVQIDEGGEHFERIDLAELDALIERVK